MILTNVGLVDYVKSKIGRGCWHGACGQIASISFLESLSVAPWSKGFYTSQYIENCKSWFGVQVFDCVGLIKAYLWGCNNDWDNDVLNKVARYVLTQDLPADGLYNYATRKGNIDSLPEVPGIILHKRNHIGVYIGNSEVVEARNVNIGVIKAKFSNKDWDHWFECPFITYKNSLGGNIMQYVKGDELIVNGKGYQSEYTDMYRTVQDYSGQVLYVVKVVFGNMVKNPYAMAKAMDGVIIGFWRETQVAKAHQPSTNSNSTDYKELYDQVHLELLQVRSERDHLRLAIDSIYHDIKKVLGT